MRLSAGMVLPMLLLISACTGGEHASKDSTASNSVPADSALPVVIDNRLPSVLGIALRETTLDPRWCLHTSRAEIRPNDFVRVVFAGGRRYTTATVGAPKAACLRSDTIAGVRNFVLKIDNIPDAFGWLGVVIRGDLVGKLDEKRGVFEAQLDADPGNDFIQDCSGAHAEHLFITSGDTLGPVRWHYAYKPWRDAENFQPTCNGRFGEPLPDTTNYAEDDLPDAPGSMIAPWSASVDSIDVALPWLALRSRGVQWELAETTIRYVRTTGACGEEGGGLTAQPIDGGDWRVLLRSISGLSAGPVKAGAVTDSVEHSPSSDSAQRARGDSASIVFAGKHYAVRSTPAGKYGFRLSVQLNGKPITLYSAKTQDEGSWRVIWAGDIDRDGKLDILLSATRKYSIDAWHLHLSSFGLGAERWLPAAEYGEVGC